LLTLITFPPGIGLRCPSPFGMKAETLLAMSGLDYERHFGDLRKAPMGKLPVLKDGAKLIPDTSHIQRYLGDEKGIDFDGHLSKKERAIATAFRRLIEEHFYFINVHFRWVENAGSVRDNLFSPVPKLARGMVFKMVQKKVIKTLNLQGIGRHSRDEIINFGVENVRALADQLGDNPYFMGKKISSIDASVYGALHGLIDCDHDTPIKQECLRHKNLVKYTARMGKELFKE